MNFSKPKKSSNVEEFLESKNMMDMVGNSIQNATNSWESDGTNTV